MVEFLLEEDAYLRALERGIMKSIKLFTIGSTQKSAEKFFTLLRANKVSQIIDVRLRSDGHLLGFSRQLHLKFFLKELCNAEYMHRPECAPPKALLDNYLSKKVDWDHYIPIFKSAIEERTIESLFDLKILSQACLLCAEPTAETCHRRLVAEYLQLQFPEIEIRHL